MNDHRWMLLAMSVLSLSALLSGCLSESSVGILPPLSLNIGDQYHYVSDHPQINVIISVSDVAKVRDGYGRIVDVVAISYNFSGEVPSGYKRGVLEFIALSNGRLVGRIDGCHTISECSTTEAPTLQFFKRLSGGLFGATALPGLRISDSEASVEPGLERHSVEFTVHRVGEYIRLQRSNLGGSDSLGCDAITDTTWVDPTSGLVHRCEVDGAEFVLLNAARGSGPAVLIGGDGVGSAVSAPAWWEQKRLGPAPVGTEVIGPSDFPLNKALEVLQDDDRFVELSISPNAVIDGAFIKKKGVQCTATLCREGSEWNIGLMLPSGDEWAWSVSRSTNLFGEENFSVSSGSRSDGQSYEARATQGFVPLAAIQSSLEELRLESSFENASIHSAVQTGYVWTTLFLPTSEQICSTGQNCPPPIWVDLNTGRLLRIPLGDNFGYWVIPSSE